MLDPLAYIFCGVAALVPIPIRIQSHLFQKNILAVAEWGLGLFARVEVMISFAALLSAIMEGSRGAFSTVVASIMADGSAAQAIMSFTLTNNPNPRCQHRPFV